MANDQMVIPPNERYKRLKSVLFEYTERIVALRNANPKIAAQQPLFFTFLTLPWLAPFGLTEDQRNYQERRKVEIAELGFDSEQAKRDLEEILANDKHLRECCPTPLQLAGYLDKHFLTALADERRQGATQERLDFAFEDLERTTYIRAGSRELRFPTYSISTWRETAWCLRGANLWVISESSA